MSAGKLFCSACREELSTKLSIVKNYVSSSKHKQSKDVVAKRQAREVDIAQATKEYDDTVHPCGETLPEVQKIFQVKVVTSF